MNIGTSLKTISKNQLCSFIGTGGYVELAENDVLSDGSIVTAAAVLPLLNSRNDKGDGILPPGYQKMEFLETSGTQYIKVPHKFNDLTGLQMKETPLTNTGSAYNWPFAEYLNIDGIYRGLRMECWRAAFNSLLSSNGSKVFRFDFPAADPPYEFSYNYKNCRKVTANGVTDPRDIYVMDSIVEGKTIVFGITWDWLNERKNGFTFAGRYYYINLSQGEELTHSLIPALDPAGEPCTFDTVTNQPFYNAGTGHFRIGIATLQQVRELQLPDNTGNAVRTLYVSLPQEARTDFTAQKHLSDLTELNWSINAQYRDGDIPADYTKVDFLESSGTQYIEFPGTYDPNSLLARCRFILPSNNESISGARGVFGGQMRVKDNPTEFLWGHGVLQRRFSGGPAVMYNHEGWKVDAVLNEIIDVQITDTSYFWNSLTYPRQTIGEITPAPMFLFVASTAIKPEFKSVGLKVLSFAWSDESHNHDLIPVINADGVPGMWDKINKQFYENSGTGAFIVGIKTLNDARMLNNALPDVTAESPDSITLSLPVEASTDAPTQKALKELSDRGWNIIVQYREDEIPAGYAKVSFLESSGTQYIELPEVFRIAQEDNPKSGIKIRSMDYQLVNNNYIFRINVKTTLYNDTYLYIGMRNKTYGTLGMGLSGHNHFPSSTYEAGKIYTAELNFLASNRAKWNNDTRDNLWGGIVEVKSQSTTLMKNATCKLLDCVLSYGTDITRNLIPVINTDGVPGMWDTVSQQFFENAGTGQFRVGLASKEAVRNLYLTPDVQEGTTINLSVPAGTTTEDTDTLKANNPNYTFNIQYRS